MEKSLAAMATLVYHLCPDLEVGVVDWIIRRSAAVIRALGFQGIARVKFIPSGPLRVEDFPEYGGCVDHARLYREYGLVFIDAGYGLQPLDQHGQPDGRERSSIERLVEEAATAENLDLLTLMPIVRVVARNDLHGTDTVERDRGRVGLRSENTPHVDRHLRNLVGGLNIVYQDKPETVLKFVHMAMNGVWHAMPRRIEEEERAAGLHLTDTGPLSEDELIRRIKEREKLEDRVVRELFVWERVVENVRLVYAQKKPDAVRIFEQASEAAFQALEQEWLRAVADYWDATKTQIITGVRVDPRAFGLPANDDGRATQLTVAVIESSSSAAGKVCRLGNPVRRRRGRDLPLNFSEQPSRPKADIVIQFMPSGSEGTKVQVSTRGATLDPITYRLRLADLRARFHCLRAGDNGRLHILMDSVAEAKQVSRFIRGHVYRVQTDGRRVTIHPFYAQHQSEVARTLRHFFISREVIILDEDALSALRERGNNTIVVRDAQGQSSIVPVLYAAEFGTLVGNAYATNPHAPPCSISPEGIVAVVIAAMRDSARSFGVDEAEARDS
jgi:hypothetical protein